MLRKEFTNPMNNSGMLKEAVNIARVELIDPSQPTTLSNVYVSNGRFGTSTAHHCCQC